jgi:hypothetical protein
VDSIKSFCLVTKSTYTTKIFFIIYKDSLYIARSFASHAYGVIISRWNVKWKSSLCIK